MISIEHARELAKAMWKINSNWDEHFSQAPECQGIRQSQLAGSCKLRIRAILRLRPIWDMPIHAATACRRIFTKHLSGFSVRHCPDTRQHRTILACCWYRDSERRATRLPE